MKRPVIALLFLFLSAWTVQASVCVESTAGAVRETRPYLNLNAIEKQIVRQDKTASYYHSAFEFSKIWGPKLAELVLKHADGNKRVKVAIAMGGAEFLGHYLRAVAKRAGVEIEFVELYLTTRMLRYWEAKEKNGSGRIRTGIGWVPRGFRRDGEIRFGSNRKRHVLNYINQSGLFQGSDKVVVVDTGYNGTIPEVINYAAKKSAYRGEVSAVMIYHNGPNIVSNSLPIESLNKGVELHRDQRGPKFKRLDWWAEFIDEGLGFDGNVNMRGFQRSRPSPTKLVQNGERWAPNTGRYRDEESLYQFQQMLLGIEDALNLPQ